MTDVPSGIAMNRPVPRYAAPLALGFAAAVYLVSWQLLHNPWFAAAARGPLPQWPVMFDLLLSVPVLYGWLHRREPRRAWLGALALAGTGILVGAYILPDAGGPLWQALGALRNLGVLAVLAFEFWAIASVLRLIAGLAREANPDYALREGIRARFGDGAAGRMMAFEARVWLQVFAGMRRHWHYAGDVHFGYHRKDDNAGNQQVFLFLLLIDLPVAHFLLALFGYVTAAWVFTVLNLLSLAFLFAHYRASLRCPVSLDADTVYVRYGLTVAECALPLAAVVAAEPHQGVAPRRGEGLLRLNESGEPNLRLELAQAHSIDSWFGLRRQVRVLYLGLDQPAAFLAELNRRRAAREPAPPAPVQAASLSVEE